jgi:transposase-like protein
MRNLQAKLPRNGGGKSVRRRAAYQAPSLALARLAAEEFSKRWGKEFPAALACFEDDDFEACIATCTCLRANRSTTRQKKGAELFASFR